jgi:phosphate starvation-inducible membrane PsiE
MVRLSATALAAAHPVHIRGIGTVIVAVAVLLLVAAGIACAVRRARRWEETAPR